MCEAGDREEKACKHLVEILTKNGRCTYHEELTKGLATLTVSIKYMFIFQGAIALLLVIHLGWR